MDFRGANETAARTANTLPGRGWELIGRGCSFTTVTIIRPLSGGLKRRFAAPYKIVND